MLLWASLMVCATAFADNAASNRNKSNAPSKSKLVCWTDAAGRRACGDAVPAQYAGQEKRILDSAGRTVKVIPGALTPEQRAVKEEATRQAAVARREAEQQAAYDRALLATYSTPQELAALRDDRLASLDTSIYLSEAAAARDAATLEELRSRIPASGLKPAPRLLDNIAKFENSWTANTHAAIDLRRNRETVCANFARDIRRFQELKSGSAEFDSPCPPPRTFTAAN
ncbi:MAG: hypothetical protein ACT4PZ_04310 [Panacagrimonas sp.]